MRRNNMMGGEKVSPFAQEAEIQGQMETQMLEQQVSGNEWEENGVRWLRQEDGSLFYLDPQSNQWVAYQQPE